MKNILITLLCSIGVLLFVGESVAKKPDMYSNQKPELSEYYTIKDQKYLGSFYLNHIYINPDEDPRLKDGYSERVWVVREDYFLIIRNPADGKMAFFDPRADAKKRISELSFVERKSESIVYKSWQVASGGTKPDKQLAGTEGRNWMQVGSRVIRNDQSPYSIDIWFVLPEAEKDPESGMEVVTLLIFNEQRLDFYFNAQGTEVAPVVNDILWTPQEELKYRKVSEQGADKVIWDYLIQNFPNDEKTRKLEEHKRRLEGCKVLNKRLPAVEYDVNKCAENEKYWGKMHLAYLEQLAVGYTQNKSLMMPRGYDLSGVKSLTTIIPKGLFIPSFGFFQDKAGETIYFHKGKITYKSDQDLIEEDNMFSHDDRASVVLYKEQKPIGLTVGGGSYHLTKQQSDFMETYCFDSTYESLCSGTSYFKVAPTTSFETHPDIHKDDYVMYGLQFIGAEFKETSFDQLL